MSRECIDLEGAKVGTKKHIEKRKLGTKKWHAQSAGAVKNNLPSWLMSSLSVMSFTFAARATCGCG
jgi:DNA-nicking Smr family endonuclease